MTALILDTNILLSYPGFIKTTQDSIVIPYSVLCELDRKKYEPGTVGLASREVSRFLENLRIQGDLAAGVKNEAGGLICVIIDSTDIPTDDSLIEVAIAIRKSNKKIIPVIVSDDVNVRIKASLRDVEARPYNDVSEKIEYKGIKTFMVDDDVINDFYNGDLEVQEDWNIAVNNYFILQSSTRPQASAVIFYDGVEYRKVKVKDDVFGIKSKNVDQLCALHAILETDTPMISLTGTAGSGKTLVAMAAALEMTLARRDYEKIIVVKSPMPVGRDVGYMPGSLSEKLSVWAGSITDNFEVLIKNKSKATFEMLQADGVIEIIPLTFLRGRSINNAVVILDEGQSLNRHEMKTLASRIGENTKFIITGDLEQIDNPRVSSLDNGLALITQAFADSSFAINLNLCRSERSDFAAEVVKRL